MFRAYLWHQRRFQVDLLHAPEGAPTSLLPAPERSTCSVRTPWRLPWASAARTSSFTQFQNGMELCELWANSWQSDHKGSTAAHTQRTEIHTSSWLGVNRSIFPSTRPSFWTSDTTHAVLRHVLASGWTSCRPKKQSERERSSGQLHPRPKDRQNWAQLQHVDPAFSTAVSAEADALASIATRTTRESTRIFVVAVRMRSHELDFYRPISSQPFSAGCHGNRNWRPIWKVAWWARVSCRRSRMYGIQCKIMQFCPVIPYSTAFFFLPEPVSCRGQRNARSNGKRKRSFTKNITTFAAVVEVLILVLIAVFFFLFFFFKSIAIRSICVHHTVPGYIDQNVFGLQSTAKKRKGYHFMKYCNASTHQPAHRKICLTPIVCIDMYFHSIFFLSTFNTSKQILIDFVMLLHWTTQQNKSASLKFGRTWQFFKKKKEKKSMAKFAKLVWLAAVQLFFCLSFFFFIY